MTRRARELVLIAFAGVALGFVFVSAGPGGGAKHDPLAEVEDFRVVVFADGRPVSSVVEVWAPADRSAPRKASDTGPGEPHRASWKEFGGATEVVLLARAEGFAPLWTTVGRRGFREVYHINLQRGVRASVRGESVDRRLRRVRVRPFGLGCVVASLEGDSFRESAELALLQGSYDVELEVNGEASYLTPLLIDDEQRTIDLAAILASARAQRSR